MAFWYDKNLGTLENASSGHSILREQRYRRHNVGKKTGLNP